MGELEDLARRRIAKWRKERGVSLERLGEVTGLHQTTVGQWEKGNSSVDVDTLAKWAGFFGRTLFDLVAHEDLSPGMHADFIAAYNALPTDALRESVLTMMQKIAEPSSRAVAPAPPTRPRRAAKRGPAREE